MGSMERGAESGRGRPHYSVQSWGKGSIYQNTNLTFQVFEMPMSSLSIPLPVYTSGPPERRGGRGLGHKAAGFRPATCFSCSRGTCLFFRVSCPLERNDAFESIIAHAADFNWDCLLSVLHR